MSKLPDEKPVAIRAVGLRPGQTPSFEIDYEAPPRRIPITVEEMDALPEETKLRLFEWTP